MDADVVADDELHPGEADAVGRDLPPAKRRCRIGEVEHHARRGGGQVRYVEGMLLEFGNALVDMALVALGAGDGHFLQVVEDVRRIAGSDDRRHAELAADDRRVRGAAAMVGDDGGSPLHDRHPVGIGDGGDEDGAIDEARDVAGVLDHADAAGGDGIADAEPGKQLLALARDLVGLEQAGLAARLHRLGPRLDDVDVAGLAVLGPFHVHRAAIVLLDGDRPAGQEQNLLVAQHEAGALELRGPRH